MHIHICSLVILFCFAPTHFVHAIYSHGLAMVSCLFVLTQWWSGYSLSFMLFFFILNYSSVFLVFCT